MAEPVDLPSEFMSTRAMNVDPSHFTGNAAAQTLRDLLDVDEWARTLGLAARPGEAPAVKGGYPVILEAMSLPAMPAARSGLARFNAKYGPKSNPLTNPDVLPRGQLAPGSAAPQSQYASYEFGSAAPPTLGDVAPALKHPSVQKAASAQAFNAPRPPAGPRWDALDASQFGSAGVPDLSALGGFVSNKAKIAAGLGGAGGAGAGYSWWKGQQEAEALDAELAELEAALNGGP